MNSQLTAAKAAFICTNYDALYGRLSTSTPLCHTQTYLALKSGVYGVLEIKVLNESRGDERVDKRILVGVH